ncbi:DegT/DnrJ/EryC1/StrS family aminotransferase [Oceaniglobus trochenteri]|uniref:DegT/DnrJ/EryC1/StrS family aminotransferase n=1 Tax=Oceaniglobus trochenteri TaxID=2763260 RepID=UPI001CFF75A7|nr:aminotransferase class I/II-fold pyridoxal phosphate-dependent enzyme [Oceaniglobus trochenteri]
MSAPRPKSAQDGDPIPDAALAAVSELLTSGDLFRYTARQDAPVTLLEQEFAGMMGARYALAVASCSAALFLSMRALDLPAGTRVLIPAFTFAAVPSSVLHAGCTPVLVECNADYRIDMEDFAAKLPGAGAVLISHMRGHTSDMDAIMALCDGAGVPVIEDAAHSLGTLWNGRRIGTIGRMGCFSFQSYKMVNAGEGGILISDDPELIARAVIMSGAYEHNWRKHGPDAALSAALARWQNRLPLYNTRLSNLSAAVARPQLAELPARIAAGLRNHDRLADALRGNPHIEVPAPLQGEVRAPDSIQFNLAGLNDGQVSAFCDGAAARGHAVQVFGAAPDNARAFWNWGFLGAIPDLPKTRAMLQRACDLRLPVRLTDAQIDGIADALLAAMDDVTAPHRATGT